MVNVLPPSNPRFSAVTANAFCLAVNVSLIASEGFCLSAFAPRLCYYQGIQAANKSLVFREVGDFLKQTAV